MLMTTDTPPATGPALPSYEGLFLEPTITPYEDDCDDEEND